MRLYILIALPFLSLSAFSQEDEKIYQSILLDSVVIIADNDFNVNRFITKVREDSSFYQAFKNLRYYPHVANGKIWVYNKKNNEKAYEEMNASQHLKKGKMWQSQEIINSSGKIKNKKGEYKFTTAQMYYDVFFPSDTVSVSNQYTSVKNEPVGTSKKDRYKHDVKIMMFNPGEDVNDVPIVGKKMSIFDDDMVEFYDYNISMGDFDGKKCYIFQCVAKPDFKADKTVIKSLTTYFDKDSMEVLKRDSHMQYQSIFFQFDVSIQVENTKTKGMLVPKNIVYKGYWNIPFKTSETIRFQIVSNDF